MIFTLFPVPFSPRRQVVEFTASAPFGLRAFCGETVHFRGFSSLVLYSPGGLVEMRGFRPIHVRACVSFRSIPNLDLSLGRGPNHEFLVIGLVNFEGFLCFHQQGKLDFRGWPDPNPEPRLFHLGIFEFLWKSRVCPPHFVVSRRAFKMEKNDRSSPYLMNSPQKKCDR